MTSFCAFWELILLQLNFTNKPVKRLWLVKPVIASLQVICVSKIGGHLHDCPGLKFGGHVPLSLLARI